MFQYNYCFGGTCCAYEFCRFVVRFNTTIVSVEPFNVGFSLFFWGSFNTTIVSVEHKTYTFNLKDLIKFQYNYCFGGTYPITGITTRIIFVSIQLLFRWNR